MMQPTPRTGESLMSSWYNRERLRMSLSAAVRLQRQLEERAQQYDMLPRRYSFLPPPNEHRFTDPLEQLFGVRSPLGRPGHTPDYPAQQPWPHEHQRSVISWSLPDPPSVELRPLADSAAPAARGRGGGWRSAAAGWSWLALVLFAVLALHVYRKRRARKVRRTRSEEWPTPNVIATNPATSLHNVDIAISPRVDTNFISSAASLDNVSNDMPPPYSECACTETDISHFGTNKFVMINEEPPPPYSSCYVAYSNPKDDLPSIHFYNSQTQRLFDNGTLDNHIRIGLESLTTNMNRNEEVLDNAEGCDASNEMISREMVTEDGGIADVCDGVANTNNNTDVVTNDLHNVGNDAADRDNIATPQRRIVLV